MIDLKKYEFWFVTEVSIFIPQTLMQVEENAKTIAGHWTRMLLFLQNRFQNRCNNA